MVGHRPLQPWLVTVRYSTGTGHAQVAKESDVAMPSDIDGELDDVVNMACSPEKTVAEKSQRRHVALSSER